MLIIILYNFAVAYAHIRVFASRLLGVAVSDIHAYV